MSKKTLVLGASIKPEKYSNFIIHKLISKNIETIAYGIKPGAVAGVTINTELVPIEDLHTVTLYLSSKNQKEYYNYIISLKPERVIFNPGTENPEFYKILKKNNIYFEIACSLVLLSTNQY